MKILPDIPEIPSRSFYCTCTVHCTCTSYCTWCRGHTAWLWPLVNGAVTTPALRMHGKDVFTCRSMLVKSIHCWENLPGFLMGVSKWGGFVVVIHLGMFQIKNRKFHLNNNGEDPVSHAACLVSSMVGSMGEKCCLHWSPTEVFQFLGFLLHIALLFHPQAKLKTTPLSFSCFFFFFFHERHVFFFCAPPWHLKGVHININWGYDFTIDTHVSSLTVRQRCLCCHWSMWGMHITKAPFRFLCIKI